MRGWAVLVFAATACASGLALWSAGCLGDLPPPTAAVDGGGDADFDAGDAGDAVMCPPPPQFAAGDCGAATMTVQGAVCPNQTSQLPLMDCLAGPRTDCACGTECAGGGPDCFQGNCPPVVAEMFPNAHCLTLAPQQLSYAGATDPQGILCYCGCTSCAVACDGIGSIVGTGPTTGPQDSGFAGLVIDLTDASLPYAGSLGFYVRVRGVVPYTFFATASELPNPRIRDTYAIVPSQIPEDGQFHEIVEYSGFVADGGLGPDTWQSPGQAPALIILGARPSQIEEVDCVIPFTLPL